MGLTIPDAEYDLCMDLARPGYIVLGLVNDLYSWEKERSDAEKAGLDYVFNAVWVIMRERPVQEDEAKDICRQEIVAAIGKFTRSVERTRNDPSLSRDLRVY